MADVSSHVSHHRLPNYWKSQRQIRQMMEPLISIQIQGPGTRFAPGDVLTCDYQIDAVDREDVVAVEASVMWYTEGKGDEDMGVHYFERRVPPDAEERDLRRWRRFESPLPNSPLSYHGLCIDIRWCVRVRAFFRQGRQCCAETPFFLGDVATPTELPTSR